MLDRQRRSLIAKAVSAVLALALIYRYWFSGALGEGGANVYLNAALVMSIGLIFLADPLVDDPGMRGLLKLLGYAGLYGQGLVAFVF